MKKTKLEEAAPDLLKACKQALIELDGGWENKMSWEETMTMIENAIKKAES